MSYDSKVKLLRLQSSLLETLYNRKRTLAVGTMAYENIRVEIETNLEKYKELVTEIDTGIYKELQEKIDSLTKKACDYEGELKLLDDLSDFYNQFTSAQDGFRELYGKFSSEELSLSSAAELNIDYYLQRRKTIKEFLDNKKVIKELKDKITEINKKLFESEELRNKVETIIIDLDNSLKNSINSSEGRIISSDETLKYTNIKNELANNDITIDDNGISEEEFTNISNEAKDAQDTVDAAEISYNTAPNETNRNIFEEIKNKSVVSKYRLVLAKIIKIIFTPSTDYVDAVEKRKNLLELLDYRKKYLEELNIRFAFDPFSRLGIDSQLNKLRLYQNVDIDADNLREELSNYSTKLEEATILNEKCLIELSVDNNIKVIEPTIKEEKPIEGKSFNTFMTELDDESDGQKTVLTNQVTEVKEKKGFNIARIKEKSRNVAIKVLKLLNKEDEKRSSSNPELVIEKKEVEESLFEDDIKPFEESEEDLFSDEPPSKEEDIFSTEPPFEEKKEEIEMPDFPFEDDIFEEEK